MLNLKNKLREEDVKPSSETIADRVHRHLRDIKSVITEDDIKNARIVLDIKIAEGQRPLSTLKHNNHGKIKNRRPRSRKFCEQQQLDGMETLL